MNGHLFLPLSDKMFTRVRQIAGLVGTARRVLLGVRLRGTGARVMLMAAAMGACGREPPAAPPNPPGISGIVVDDQTSLPLAGVHVFTDPQSGNGTTLANGRYAFSADPNRYRVIGERSGYFNAEGLATVRDGPVSVDLRLKPEGAVAVVGVTLQSSVLSIGQTTTAIAEVRNAAGQQLANRGKSFSSGNASVATVDPVSGLVRAIAIGTTTISATSEGKTGSATLSVVPAAATQLVVVSPPSGAISGVALTGQPVIEVRDASNVIVASGSHVITATISSGTGVVAGATSVATAGGVASFTGLAVNGAGPHVITFSSPGLQSVQSPQFVVTQVATSLAVTTQPSGAQSGLPFAVQPVVEVRDAAGLRHVTSSVPITVSASGPGTLAGPTTTNAVAGVGTFSGLRITGVGQHSLVFTVNGLPSVSSGAFSVGTGAVVSVVASDSVATEYGPDGGEFTIIRTGSTAAGLDVNIAMSGTATPGVDYQLINSTVTIPAGQTTVTVPVTVVADTLTESAESVILSILPGAYTVGLLSSAAVMIQGSGSNLLNGGVRSGAIAAAGEIDRWTFRAPRNSRITLSVGKTTPASSAFGVSIQLIDSTGYARYGYGGSENQWLGTNATSGGEYTVVVRSVDAYGYANNGTGAYRVWLVVAPGAFDTTPSSLPATGSTAVATIEIGGMSTFTFSATSGARVTLTASTRTTTSGSAPLYPWLNLVAPDGYVRSCYYNAGVCSLDTNVSSTGQYVVIVGSADVYGYANAGAGTVSVSLIRTP